MLSTSPVFNTAVFQALCACLELPVSSVEASALIRPFPNDPESPFVTSGVRIGTPAVTSRGFDTADMDRIAEYIGWTAGDFENKAAEIKAGVAEMCRRHPIYE